MVERLICPLSASALLAVSLLTPNPELKIGFFVASFLLALCALVKYLTQPNEPAPVVEDEKHIILFDRAVVLDPSTVQCVHCGQSFGVGIEKCPRCKRTQHVLA